MRTVIVRNTMRIPIGRQGKTGPAGKNGEHGPADKDGNTYLCQRTGGAEGGMVVLQYIPHELVVQYFEEVS